MILHRSDIDREDEADQPDAKRVAHGSEEREHEVEHLGTDDCDADDEVEDCSAKSIREERERLELRALPRS